MHRHDGNKYSAFQYQKYHEYEYKKFLETLELKKKSCHISLTKSPHFSSQITPKVLQDRRKLEYERIHKENLQFSQRLINAKPVLSRSEQDQFFHKHCQIKQRLRKYPNLFQTKINHQYSLNDSICLIYKNCNKSHNRPHQLKTKQEFNENETIRIKDMLPNQNRSKLHFKTFPYSITESKRLATSFPSIHKN